MKVIHLSSGKTWRGGEQQVDYLINSNFLLVEHYLFCPEDSELQKRNLSISKKVITYKKRFGFDLFAARALKKACREKKIDLIHLHDSHSINTYLLANLFGMNIPAVIHRHVNFPLKNKWKYKYSKVKKIICVSEVVKNNLSGFIDAKKLIVIHPAIGVKRFSAPLYDKMYLRNELNINPDKKIIGTITSLTPEKNTDEFISIAKLLCARDKNLIFVIAGTGYDQPRHESRIKKEGLMDSVKILGFRNDIPEILSSIDVFLFTSKNEGFGQVLLEAMAARVPVVTTNAGGIADIITDLKNGLVYKSGDPVDGALKVTSLLSDETLCRIMVANGVKFVRQFDVPLMIEKIETVYKEALQV